MFKKVFIILSIIFLPLSYFIFHEVVKADDNRISILISGQEFNELILNAENIIFSNDPISSDLIQSSIDVSTDDSLYKSYLYIDNGTYIIAPQFSNVSIYANANSSYMFSGCQSLKSITFDNFNTSTVIDMRDMFELCTSLERLDLSTFDTSNVEFMQYMFYSCSNLYSLNLDSFNLDSLLDMTEMFGLCPYLQHYSNVSSSFVNQDLTLIGSDWTWLKTEQIGSTNDGSVWLRIYAKLDGQDIQSRTSTVSYKSTLYYKKSSSYTFYANSGTYKYLNGSGSTPIVKAVANGTYKGGETVLSTTTGTVSHNDNGKATISVSARFTSSPWGWDTTVSSDAALPDLPISNKFNVTVNVSPEFSGTVDGGGIYDDGSIATLTANPSSNYVFSSWSDGITDNPRNITVNSDISLTAIFESTITQPNIPNPPVVPPSYSYNDSFDSIISNSTSSIISGGSLSMIEVDHYNVYTVVRSAQSDQFFANRNNNYYTYVSSSDGVGHYIFLVYDYSEIFVHAPNMIVSQHGIQPVKYSYTDDTGQLVTVIYPSGDGIIQSDISEFYIKYSDSYLYNNFSYTNLPFSNSPNNENHLEWVGTKTNVYKSNLGKQFASISIDDSNSPYSLNFMVCDKLESLDNAKLQETTQKGNNILSNISNFFNQLINGNDKSNTIISNQNTFNDKVNDRLIELDSIESNYLNKFNNSLNDIDLSKFNISKFGSDFIPTANFVSTCFNNLTDNYFGLALGFSLIVGFALLLFGRRL